MCAGSVTNSMRSEECACLGIRISRNLLQRYLMPCKISMHKTSTVIRIDKIQHEYKHRAVIDMMVPKTRKKIHTKRLPQIHTESKKRSRYPRIPMPLLIAFPPRLPNNLSRSCPLALVENLLDDHRRRASLGRGGTVNVSMHIQRLRTHNQPPVQHLFRNPGKTYHFLGQHARLNLQRLRHRRRMRLLRL